MQYFVYEPSSSKFAARQSAVWILYARWRPLRAMIRFGTSWQLAEVAVSRLSSSRPMEAIVCYDSFWNVETAGTGRPFNMRAK